jgi:putative ABC transport system permease protein
MNLLALDESAILVSRSFAYDEGVTAGGRVSLELWGQNVEFVVVGVLDHFPTLYPQDGHFFVANRDYLEYRGALGARADVWLNTEDELDLAALESQLLDRGIFLVAEPNDRLRDSLREIKEEKEHPERIGLFGILSIGFIASILLTTLGIVVYGLLSLERRQVQLGILRAMGLSRVQLMTFAVFHQAFLGLVGLGVGTGLGLGVARLFTPFLQIGADKYAQVPPIRTVVAWAEIFKMYGLLGLALGASVLGSLWLLSRMQIYEAVKLGEEQVM